MKRILIMMTWIAMIFSGTIGIMAQEAVPDLDPGASGTLRVDLVYGTGTQREPLSGVELCAVQVATLETERGAAIYTTLSPFDAEKINWSEMTAADSETAASKLMQTAKTQSVSYLKQTTDGNGQVIFNNLKPGMYLVYQTKAADVNRRFEEMKPFLVSVPSYKKGVWIYEINAQPKAEIIRKKPVSSRPPTTGVMTWIENPAILIMISALAFIVIHQFKKRLAA